MKPRKTAMYPGAGARETPQTIKEAAAAYGLRREVVSVREAKDQLSGLLQRAARGEQIVITSDGQPKAMIVRYRPAISGQPWRPHEDLRAKMPQTPDSTATIREMRDSGY
ncbi:MAG TPA: type II toxin-antitoxin system prevent-host-death family antitoxin [Opitutus sp.]|nr:type II toxin-antitoxin system prevent-host-death family antitoxin [Opitutus sp.]